MAFEKLGTTGQSLATLQTFKFNYIYQMTKYGQEAAKGNFLPFAHFMALQLLLGGMTGALGMDELDDLWETVKAFLPNDAYNAVKDISIKGWLVEHMGDFLSYGGLSTVTGTNIYSRFDASNAIPGDPLSLGRSMEELFPHVAETWKMGKGVMNFFSSDPAKATAAEQALTPSAFRGLHDVESDVLTSSSGMARSISGGQISGKYQRDDFDTAVRMYGLKSLEEAKASEKDFRFKRMQKELNDRRQAISKKVVNQIVTGNVEDLESNLKTYVKLGGDGNSLVADGRIQEAFINANTTELQRLAIAAQSGKYPAVYSLMLYIQGQQQAK